MPTTLSYEQRLDRWLKAMGLTADPFASSQAEREMAVEKGQEPQLPFLFIDRPYLSEVMGNPDTPQAAFLLADRGCGKTAARAMVAHLCRQEPWNQQVLLVEYTDFSPLLQRINYHPAATTARDHVAVVLRAAVRAVEAQIPSDRWEHLSPLQRQDMEDYVNSFADPFTKRKLAKFLGGAGQQIEWDELSVVEIMNRFADLVAVLGRQTIYILVDCVDEIPPMSDDPQAVLEVLAPLVKNQAMLRTSRVAFKLFLPLLVAHLLGEANAVRMDRALVRQVTWDRKALLALIQQRLLYYSDQAMDRPELLCAAGKHSQIVDRLVQASHHIPRTLLDLGSTLIRYHVEHGEDPAGIRRPSLISEAEIGQAIEAFERDEQRISVVPFRTTSAQTEAPPTKGLYLDRGGNVWINAQRTEMTLSPHEQRLLQALYERRGAVVSMEELIRQVWGSEAAGGAEAGVVAYDDTNLRKLIARLRDRMNDQTPGLGIRLVKNVRGRGYRLSWD